MLDDEDHLELHQGALESGIQLDDEDAGCLMVKMLDDEVDLTSSKGSLIIATALPRAFKPHQPATAISTNVGT